MRYRSFLIIPVLIISCAAAVARPDKHKPKADDQEVERTTAADPKVVLSVCLGSGNITVHGWDRNQVHARMSDGMQIEFQPSAASNSAPPKELNLGMNDGQPGPSKRCLPFGNLELDVPREATVKVQGGDAEINASGVAKVSINTQNGAVTVERVTGAVDINTLGGEITVLNSQGAIKVHSVGGDIEVHDVSPRAPEDVCDVGNVGGDITLESISHRQVKAGTVAGDVTFKSALARSGRYSFQSVSGDLTLMLPPDSSFRLSATIQDEPDTDFAIEYSSTDPPPPDANRKYRPIPRKFEGTYGTGDAQISFSSFNGSVHLRKE
ncbi:MAG TPA: DUF4097 family beta strand repeat-containing protein [Pyrinomonadaceae bacterium]|nr:DUF4097 family beta strand repeat-containing protein [Pyrinomonadaceae bacterium]